MCGAPRRMLGEDAYAMVTWGLVWALVAGVWVVLLVCWLVVLWGVCLGLGCGLPFAGSLWLLVGCLFVLES